MVADKKTQTKICTTRGRSKPAALAQIADRKIIAKFLVLAVMAISATLAIPEFH
jgi:hypothetical protein